MQYSSVLTFELHFSEVVHVPGAANIVADRLTGLDAITFPTDVFLMLNPCFSFVIITLNTMEIVSLQKQ